MDREDWKGVIPRFSKYWDCETKAIKGLKSGLTRRELFPVGRIDQTLFSRLWKKGKELLAIGNQNNAPCPRRLLVNVFLAKACTMLA